MTKIPTRKSHAGVSTQGTGPDELLVLRSHLIAFRDDKQMRQETRVSKCPLYPQIAAVVWPCCHTCDRQEMKWGWSILNTLGGRRQTGVSFHMRLRMSRQTKPTAGLELWDVSTTTSTSSVPQSSNHVNKQSPLLSSYWLTLDTPRCLVLTLVLLISTRQTVAIH